MHSGRNWVWCAALVLLISYAALGEPKEFTAAQKRWWAFQKATKPAVPAVRNVDLVSNPIDAFLLAKLEEKGLRPNPPADKATLLRRATLDLTGLPPTPEELQAFLSDLSPQAFERVVDRLLASPRYGERWARHWLDLARYADSEGFKTDETRPNIWRYRDYVIDSFNSDKPYDRFMREQIAGDELYPNDPAALVATGFNRHFPDESNAKNLMQRRQEILNDITDTVGSTFLAMTYGCARCHDHKFDPILQKDYYRLQAFFANTRIEDHAVLETGARKQAWQQQYSEWDAKTRDVRDAMSKLVAPEMAKLYKETFDKFPAEIQDALTTEPDKRTPIQWHMYHKARWALEHNESDVARKLKGAAAQQYREMAADLAKYDSIKPPALPVAQAMVDNDSAPPKTHVLAVGVYDALREEVVPGFLSILDPTPAKIVPPESLHSSGRRTALANWLADPRNPLTARVMVNRLWNYHFGRGIVGTPSDFGVMGERPSNKDLLDYLASTFVEQGWSMKSMHRLMMLSNAYRQSSAYQPEAAKVDPDNHLVWRYNRHRLEGEAIRDSMLYASGRLNLKVGGPGVFPPLPPGVVTRGGWKSNEDPSESNRRSVYVFVRRNTRYPMFQVFDMPDTHESCARRNNTVTPGQSLELMNSELVAEWSRALAERVMNDSGLTPEAQVDRAYKLAYSRLPDDAERAAALKFLDRQTTLAAGSKPAFADLCQVLLDSNEFLYVN